MLSKNTKTLLTDTMKFRSWLLLRLKVYGQHDAIADIARDVKDDEDWPTSQKLETLKSYLDDKRACPAAQKSLDEAYRVWRESGAPLVAVAVVKENKDRFLCPVLV